MTLASSRPVRIQICGALAIERDGQRLDAGLPGRQGRLLFTYLVVNRHRHVPRDELAEALWREPDPAAVDARLNPLLSKLRRPALPAPGVLPQVQVGKVQPAQFADPEPAVTQPGDHQPVPGRRGHPEQLVPRALGQRLRMPPPHRPRGQRVEQAPPGSGAPRKRAAGRPGVAAAGSGPADNPAPRFTPSDAWCI